jgi:hemerythrin-like domain-containing protein
MAPPDDPHALLHWQMVNIHTAFKCGFDNMLKHLVSPPADSKELHNLIGYCLSWSKSLHSHHDSEEAAVFPFLNTKLDFSREIEEHKVIHAKLEEMEAYLSESLTAKDPNTFFSAEKFRTMLTDLREPLFAHLDGEVSSIQPENLQVFGGKDLLDMDHRLEEYVKAHDDPFVVLPFLMGHVSPAQKKEWPPFPWVLKKVLIPYVFSWRYAG